MNVIDARDLSDSIISEGTPEADVVSVPQGGRFSGGLGNDVISVESTFDLPGGQANPFVHAFINGNMGDDTLVGGETSDVLLGGRGNDSIADFFGADTLNGNLGDDVIASRSASLMFGEGGNDTLTAQVSGATLSGGEGADLLRFEHLLTRGAISTGVVLDWDAGDRLFVSRFVPGHDYREMSADDLASATNAANAAIHAGAEVVVVEVGHDVYAFFQSELNAGANVMVQLVGRSLADISADNIV